jgi:hypothetical protein
MLKFASQLGSSSGSSLRISGTLKTVPGMGIDNFQTVSFNWVERCLVKQFCSFALKVAYDKGKPVVKQGRKAASL